MSEHHEYPMTMAHPGYRASQSLPVPGTERRDAMGKVISCDYQGTPEVLAPVTVADFNQREYYEAQGYVAAGHSDPAAYAMAHASPAPPNYAPVEYPKYRDGVLLNSAEEEAAKFPVKAEEQAGEGVSELREKYAERFGKKPYMGWDADTLKEKLAA